MFYTVLLGIATGMRTMTPMAVLCWAAYIGWLPVEGTWCFWMAKLVSPLVFTALALGEYVGDTLPQTPSRTDLPLVGGRLAFGILAGVVVATALTQPRAGGVIFGAIGALIGTFGGHRLRVAGAHWAGRDLPIALSESALALGFAVLSVTRIHHEVVTGAARTLHLLR